MERVLKADTRPSVELDFDELKRRVSQNPEETQATSETPQFAKKD
jgi:hypothetical protein